MAEKEPEKVESESSEKPSHLQEEKPPKKDVNEEKYVTSPQKLDESNTKALAVVQKPIEPAEEKTDEGSINRDDVLTRVALEKRMSLIKAWEENEKSKAENKAHKKISAIGTWENSKKASVEAELKKIEEKLEKKKAEYVENKRNKIALIHKAAEEKKAAIEAKRKEDLLMAEEIATTYRTTETSPRKLLNCFTS